MSDAEHSDSSSVEQNQIRISLRLAKECHDNTLSVPSAAIAVPADVGRKGLSAVVNHLLEQHNDNALSFDFIVGDTGRLLRTGLEREARRSGISLEEAVPLTYFPALPTPEVQQESEEAPDWIDSLCVHDDTLVAGCYDGSLVTYSAADGQLDKRSIRSVHKGAVKCVSLQNHASSNGLLVASGSMDQSLKLSTLNRDGQLQPLAECLTGHSSSISSVAFCGSTKRLASADWDGGLCVWNPDDIQKKEERPEHSSKKSKSNKKSVGKPSDTEGTVLPLLNLRVHASNVSGIHWEKDHLLTCSWDHSLKVWDMEKQNCVLTLNGSRVISGMDASHHSPGIVATGHPDCSIRLWDTRIDTKENSDAINENTFRPSHKEWVSCVKWSKRNAYHLASTSHDGSVKLWDIRSSIPLHTVRAFPQKAKGLCLEFGPSADERTRIFVGGTDCIVKQYSI